MLVLLFDVPFESALASACPFFNISSVLVLVVLGIAIAPMLNNFSNALKSGRALLGC